MDGKTKSKDSIDAVIEQLFQTDEIEIIGSSKSKKNQQANKKTSNLNGFITATTLLKNRITEIPKLLDPFLPKVGVVSIIGSSDTGKSSFLRQLAYETVIGSDTFLGYKINATHRSAIYVSTEDDEMSISVLLEKQIGGNKDPANMNRLKFVFQTDSLLKKLDQEITNNPVDLIIIDAFADLYNGQMNQINEVRRFLTNYSELAAKHKCLIIFLHHTGKRTDSLLPGKENAIGSQGFEAKMRLVIELRKDPKSPDIRHLCIVKGNYLPHKYKTRSIALRFKENMSFENLNYGVRFEDLIINNSGRNKNEKAIIRTAELKKDGFSIREVTDILQKEGFKIRKTAVGEWMKKM